MKIYNAFGIKPTNTYVSAGTDYYIPNINTLQQEKLAYEAFKKSYKVSDEDLGYIIDCFKVSCRDERLTNQMANLVHLFLALYDPNLEEYKNIDLLEAVKYFLDEFVEYDAKNDKVGIHVYVNDALFINSGIKVALDTVLSDQVGPNKEDMINKLRSLGIGIAGLYVNKSGMGNKGWDVRACLVDEDYAGYVHLSMSFTKDDITGNNIVYCGDKLTQMMLIPVFHTRYEEVSEEEYAKAQENSQRGDAGFGSSDVKH